MTRTDWSGYVGPGADVTSVPDAGLLAAAFEQAMREAPYPVYRCVGCGTPLREIGDKLRHMVGFRERYGCTNPEAASYEPVSRPEGGATDDRDQ